MSKDVWQSDGADVIAFVNLLPKHVRTGRTEHWAEGAIAARPKTLQICHYDGARDAFYLFHLDKHQKVLTDTFHETIAEAMEQARFEFEINPDDWTMVESVG